MKHILLPEAGNGMQYYRANLHCHSTISDGGKTVEELKRDYMKNGYSIIAFTDHEAFVPHNDLTDENFLALNGYELSINERDRQGGEDNRCCHLCFVALTPDNFTDVCYHRTKYIGEKYRDIIVHDENAPDFEREYTPECINEMIKRGVQGGFFVTYNHPVWSLESYPEYTKYHGMHAMEISNFASIVAGWDDDNGHCYEDMLNGGERLFCVGADDNHNRVPDTDPACGSYGGYTEIAAPSLTYEDIADALKNGRFYASTGDYTEKGPKILSLTYEDGKVHIKTGDARSIYITHNTRCAHAANAKKEESVNEAEFSVDTDAKWFRLTVVDHRGFKSYTNAYFPAALK